jgi:hypothetical protein
MAVIRPTSKAHLRAATALSQRFARGGAFFSGLLAGLGAATLAGGTVRRTRYASDGIRGDWKAVGDDMRAVLRQMNDPERR